MNTQKAANIVLRKALVGRLDESGNPEEMERATLMPQVRLHVVGTGR